MLLQPRHHPISTCHKKIVHMSLSESSEPAAAYANTLFKCLPSSNLWQEVEARNNTNRFSQKKSPVNRGFFISLDSA